MKKLLKPLFMMVALAAVVGFGNVQSAFAVPVTFTTTGQFFVGGVAQGSTITFGGNTLTFAGLSSTVDPATTGGVSNDNFGTFTPAGASATGVAVPANTTFQLTISQTAPTVGTGVATANVTGTLSSSASTLFLTFTTNTVTIGGQVYTLDNLRIGEPDAASTLQGTITQTNPIPEPATMILLGTGLAGIAAKVRRRKGSAQAE